MSPRCNVAVVPTKKFNGSDLRYGEVTMRRLLVAAALFATASAGAAAAQSTLETLGQMKTTGVKEITFIEQGGANADAIRATLDRINLPPGFKIDLYAVVPDARHMAVGPQGVAVFVGTRKNDAWVVTDRNKDRVADEVKRFAQSLELTLPNGPCFSKDGFLFIAEQTVCLCILRRSSFTKAPTWSRCPSSRKAN